MTYSNQWGSTERRTISSSTKNTGKIKAEPVHVILKDPSVILIEKAAIQERDIYLIK